MASATTWANVVPSSPDQPRSSARVASTTWPPRRAGRAGRARPRRCSAPRRRGLDRTGPARPRTSRVRGCPPVGAGPKPVEERSAHEPAEHRRGGCRRALRRPRVRGRLVTLDAEDRHGRCQRGGPVRTADLRRVVRRRRPWPARCFRRPPVTPASTSRTRSARRSARGRRGGRRARRTRASRAARVTGPAAARAPNAPCSRLRRVT